MQQTNNDVIELTKLWVRKEFYFVRDVSLQLLYESYETSKIY